MTLVFFIIALIKKLVLSMYICSVYFAFFVVYVRLFVPIL